MHILSRSAPRFTLPERAFEGDVPLVAVQRGDRVGSVHRGTAAVVSGDRRTIVALGDPNQRTFLRSAAKPFQVMPAILAGALDRFDLTDRELAVLCASHSAEPHHQQAVLSVLRKGGLGEESLQCGPHPPLHEETARHRIEARLEPTPLCNNCSGAHAGMLLACRAAGWTLNGYGDPSHPLQQLTVGILADFAGISPDEVGLAIDNCAVPAFELPIGLAAQAFARLSTGEGVREELSAAAVRVVRAMVTCPEMVGGEGRFDTDLMRAAGGAVISKGGAEGFQGVGLPEEKLGMAIKISDGNSRAVAPTAIRILQGIGALNAEQLSRLGSYAEPRLYNHQGDQVGQIVPLFRIGE